MDRPPTPTELWMRWASGFVFVSTPSQPPSAAEVAIAQALSLPVVWVVLFTDSAPSPVEIPYTLPGRPPLATYYCSATTGENVLDAFKELRQKMVDKAVEDYRQRNARYPVAD